MASKRKYSSIASKDVEKAVRRYKKGKNVSRKPASKRSR